MKKIIRLTESDLTKIVKKVILETSLSRVHRHIMQHDCAVITGFRNKMENCAFDVKKKDELLKRFEKKDRNFVLKKALLNNGYGVTDVMGSYVENYMTDNAIEVKEESLFVVNRINDPKFLDFIITLGKVFCQDSVLIIKKGGKNNFMVGTNHAEFPGLDKIVKLEDFKPGYEGEFMTRVNDRPFTL